MERHLNIEPQDLSFIYEVNKQSTSSIKLTNKTNQPVAFKVMTTKPKSYCVLPNMGVVLPGSSCDVLVTMIAPTALPTDAKCPDKFLIKTVVASTGATTADGIKKLFDKETGSQFQDCKLGVIYTFPSQASSTVIERSFSTSVGSETTNLNNIKMDVTKLVQIQPSDLKFDFKPMKELSCFFKMTNMTESHIFFKVKTTDPNKYCVQQNIGILLPQSTCDVIVRMKAQEEIPQDRQSRDKFLIQCTAGSPAVTVKNITSEMFNKEVHFVEEFKLGVVFDFPSQPQSSISESSEIHSSPEPAPLQEEPLNYISQVIQELIGSNRASPVMKSIAASLIGIIFWQLFIKFLPQIWSLSIVIGMLAVKMTQYLVSNSVEEWIVKTLADLIKHFIAIVFGRRANSSLTPAS
ncbi:hypothetical protein ACP275_05G082700 [Erythranthe tilingii]